MRKLLYSSFSILFIISSLFSNVYAYNPDTGVGTQGGINYWDDGETAPIKLTYSNNNDPNYSLWESQGKTWVPQETQGVIAKTFYRSSDALEFTWSTKHTDSVNTSSGCGTDDGGNACACNRDTYSFSENDAKNAVRNNEYYSIEDYQWKESWSVKTRTTCTSWGCPGTQAESPHGTWVSDGECAAAYPSCTGSTSLVWHYEDLLDYYSCKGCPEETSCLNGDGKASCPGTCNAVQCYRSSCIYYPEGQISTPCDKCIGSSTTHTDYIYGTIERHSSTGWSPWSEWTVTPITENNKRKVQTVVLYSYPLTETWTYDAFALSNEDINFGEYTASESDFTWSYTPFTYNLRNYVYYYVPALKVCRVRTDTPVYQSQMVLRAWLNDSAPTVADGTNVTLKVSLYGGEAQSYQWQSRKSNSDTWANISGAVGNTYSFTAKAEDDGKEFRCVVNGKSTNIAANAVAESNIAQLIILK